jgi:glycosyltransferase involved in cell wall biosynthesis
VRILYWLCDPTWRSVHRTGGYGVHVREVVAALERAGHEVELLDVQRLLRPQLPPVAESGNGGSGGTPSEASGGGGWIDALPGSVRAVGRDVLYLLRDRRAGAILRRRLAGGGVDLVYERFHHMQVSGVAAAHAAGLPVIVEFNAGQNEVVSHQGAGLVGLARKRERRALSQADRVIAVSGVLRRYLMELGVPAGRVVVRHNGVDLGRFRPGLEGGSVRRQLGIGPQEVVAGFAGSLAGWHDADLLVEAAGRLRDRGVPLRVVLVGGRPGSPRFRELARLVRERGLEGRVHLTGAVPPAEMPRYLAAMDVGTMPWTNEYGSPLKIFEYLASGLAVVAPDREVIREVLTDGQDSLLVPRDPDRLADALERLAREPDLRRRLGRAGRARAETHHAWDQHARLIETLYEDIRRERSEAAASVRR